MAKDYFLPYNDLTNLVPQNLRNPVVRSLLDNLFNRFMTQDESVPLFGYVGRKPASVDDKTQKIPQQSIERDINALIPVLSFKVGQETFSFTIEDLIRKAEVLGISENQVQWLYSQGNNYSPPIDLDKFTNFFNWYWVGNALPSVPEMPWNPTRTAEYFVIARPAPADLDKLNVRVATTSPIVLTGSGFYTQTWTVAFTDATHFTVTANGALNGFAPGEQVQSFTLPTLPSVPSGGPYPSAVFPVSFIVSSASEPLLRFNVVRDVILDNSGGPYTYEGFTAGDTFTINAPFLTSTYSVTFSGGPGQKGKILAVDALDTYQTIDGVLLKENDRVLVRHGAATVQGIYVVSPGTWALASDFDSTTASASARVFVTNGSQANTLWESIGGGGGYGWVLDPSTTISNTNDWQEGNFWVHRDGLAALNLDLALITQAVRPIIEFQSSVQLNTHVSAGYVPSDTGTEYQQRKHEFNQLPLFDLYRYDGTHTGKVTPLFFYVEDPTAVIDTALQRRIKLTQNASSDYLFDHGLIEDNDTLLFYKKNGSLHTIWHPGYTAATVVDQSFSGTGNGALVVSVGGDAFSAQQIWTLTAISPTQFSVVGSKTQVLPPPRDVITVGTTYSNSLFSAVITAGSISFVAGDTFVFRIGNFETTRYVYRDTDDGLHDLYGGPGLDDAGIGAWQVPRMFFNNVAAENSGEISEGTIYSHFRGILANQLAGTDNRAFGGSIKLWSEQQNLLAALLMQRDVTPINVIDLAQRQYEVALNAIADLYLSNVLDFFSRQEVLVPSDDVKSLADYLTKLRSFDNDVRTVLYDSTSPVIGFPPTLPLMGITPLVQPGIVFDDELGVELFQHHDGHLSALYVQSPDFRDRFLSANTTVQRSDGTKTSAIGSYTTAMPPYPYKGLIWMYPGSDTEYRVFDVIDDTSVAPTTTVVGAFWYNRAANVLAQWDGTGWVAQPSLDAAWVVVDFAELLNSVVAEIENQLYAGINAEQRVFLTNSEIDAADSGALAGYMQEELAVWAVQNGFDPLAPDYVSTDAFTWNYSSSLVGSFAPVSTASIPARWFDALTAHQAAVSGVIPTARPNIEPWKLLGNTTKPASWDPLYKAEITPTDLLNDALTDGGVYATGATVDVVSFSASSLFTTLAGLPIVDGVQLTAGQKILLVSESAAANNGPWVVSSASWTRASVPLQENTVITVQNGLEFSGTAWAIMADVPVVNTSPVLFTQVRLWKASMWTAIKAAVPTLKLSVDTNRDALLPPYVAAALPWSVNALTTAMPPYPAEAYEFGESSPVQTVWKKSMSYRYSIARASFKYDPLAFLGNCWGFEWVLVDGILYDGFDITVPGHPRFRLHGDPVQAISRSNPISVASITAAADFELVIVHDGYTPTRKQSFSVIRNDTVIAYVQEGISKTFSAPGINVTGLLIEDRGQPYRVGDAFTVIGSGNGSGITATFSPASYHQINGLGQTFAHALRVASIDTTQGYAIQAYRGWDVNLGYRAGGLVDTDDLRVYTDNESLPESAYELRFKKSSYANDLWAQALRITVVQMGASVLNGVGKSIPVNAAEDWTFRIEGYNQRYLGISYYSMAGNYTTFKALSGAHTNLEWLHYSDVNGMPFNAQLPFTITGLQNVVTFLYGYAKKLEDDGWLFDDPNAQNIDAETGRVRNWQLEIEKLVDRIYAGTALGEGHICNPFMDRIWLQQDTGLLASFFDTALFDVQAHPAVFDVLGTKIKTEDLDVLRSRGSSQIGAKVPMYSAHAQIDEYEHLFVFNNISSPSTNEGLIYDPFSGARVVTMKLNGRRQGAKTMRPEFGGHYLVGDEVKKNFQASTDKIARYYDADHVFEDEVTTKHALALLGFTPKQYMADLDLNSNTQFNFWRGMIQMKGTNASISAFLNNDRFQDAKLDEYWAYKVAEYGDARPKIFPELRLTVDDTIQQFTKLMFDEQPANDFTAFTYIDSSDEDRWFNLEDLDALNSQPVTFEAAKLGTFTAQNVVADQVIELDFMADLLLGSNFTIVNASTVKVTADAAEFTVTGWGASVPKFNPVKLFNYVDAELVEEIAFWHPAVGQHTPAAMESVNIISTVDPARYNISTQVIGNSNYDPLRMWGANEVGRVWFDTTNLDYLPYADSTVFQAVEERLSRWGTLADYATVDVVEWVESTVPPSQYNEQSILDAGNSDITGSSKADGTVYGAKTYTRDRVWAARPIAWSHSGVALEAAHPSFNSSYLSTLTFESSGQVALETGTFADYGIETGMRLGAWQEPSAQYPNYRTRPLSEYVITSFSKKLTGLPLSGSNSGFAGSIVVSVTQHTDKVGVLSVSATTSVQQLRDADGLLVDEWDVLTYIAVLETLSGVQDVVLIRNDRGTDALDLALHGAEFTAAVGQQFEYFVPSFGLKISVKSTVAGTFPTDALANMLATALAENVSMFDAAVVQEVVGLSDPDLLVTDATSFSNDENDTLYTVNNGIGWRAWSVPTQVQLDADAIVPNGSWYPYTGEYLAYPLTPIGVVQDTNSTFLLNNGQTIERYQKTWSVWTELNDVILKKVAIGTGDVVFSDADEMHIPYGTTVDRLSVYVNGIAQLTGTFALVGTTLTVFNVPSGHRVTAIVRAYSPTVIELAFDPTVKDDPKIQRQYKVDYQYVEVPVRDLDGTVTSTKYYFWVKNRTTAAAKNNLSVKSVAQLISSGPSQYLTFQHIKEAAGVPVYNAIAIAGLNYVVTQDNTFKLRFTRNFTLRDDPNQLDLKDTHVEWSLIRPGQRTRIPEKLWNLLVNTACGIDAAGNVLPSQRRVAYDERNGTTTRFGFGTDQVLAPSELVTSTLLFTILNTKLVDETGSSPMPDLMLFLNFSNSDSWFSTPANARATLTKIWNEATPQQINELFFAVLDDIVAANYELTDLFKTSRLSAYSIKVVRNIAAAPTYE